MVNIVYEEGLELLLPEHLDVPFFEEVLETALRTSRVELVNIHCSMGSCSGENFCSQVYRMNITYQRQSEKGSKPKDQEISIIVKNMPQSSLEFIDDLEFYLKEKIMYYEVLPRLDLLMQFKRRFGPKLYHCMKKPDRTLAFEDLRQLGYVNGSRESGLDEDHARLVLERLAEFHATSMVLAKLDKDVIAAFGDGMLSPKGLERDQGLLMRFIDQNGHQLHSMVSTWPGFEGIADKIAKYLMDHRDQLVRAQAPLENEIKVLNHGDMWVNNMLFKYTKGEQLQDVIFIDFQLSYWGSPGIDLNYFFYTSLRLDVLKHKRPQLLKAYHNRLAKTLIHLDQGIPIPSFQQVLTEVHRREAYGFFASYGILPTISQDSAHASDSSLENFNDAEFAKQKTEQLFASPRLEKTFRYALPNFERAGVFD